MCAYSDLLAQIYVSNMVMSTVHETIATNSFISVYIVKQGAIVESSGVKIWWFPLHFRKGNSKTDSEQGDTAKLKHNIKQN